MSILNYSTSISAERTAAEIQQKLVRAKATAVLCEYSGAGALSAMSFRIDTAHGVLSFRLPANVAGVLRALSKDPRVDRRLKTEAHARNVAWRVLKDWIEAQLAIVEAEVAEMAQVFLPYAQDASGATIYERLKGGHFQSLTHKPEAPRG